MTPEEIVHIALGDGVFTGAFGVHYGSEARGASDISISGGNTDTQLMISQEYRSSAPGCTPSYGWTPADRREKQGRDLRSLALRVGLFGAEPRGNKSV